MNYKSRPGSTTKKKEGGKYPPGTKAMMLGYVDARQVFERLDQVFGVGNWSRRIIAVNSDGSVTAGISAHFWTEATMVVGDPPDGGRWVTVEHQDIGYKNAPDSDMEDEPLKAAASDAFKRAAVGFGIGAFLYNLPQVWQEIDERGRPIGNAPRVANSAPPRVQDAQQGSTPQSAPAAPQQGAGGSWQPSDKQLNFIRVLAKKKAALPTDDQLAQYVFTTYGEYWPQVKGPTAKKLIDGWKDLADLEEGATRQQQENLDDATYHDWTWLYKQIKPRGFFKPADIEAAIDHDWNQIWTPDEVYAMLEAAGALE